MDPVGYGSQARNFGRRIAGGGEEERGGRGGGGFRMMKMKKMKELKFWSQFNDTISLFDFGS